MKFPYDVPNPYAKIYGERVSKSEREKHGDDKNEYK